MKHEKTNRIFENPKMAAILHDTAHKALGVCEHQSKARMHDDTIDERLSELMGLADVCAYIVATMPLPIRDTIYQALIYSMRSSFHEQSAEQDRLKARMKAKHEQRKQ